MIHPLIIRFPKELPRTGNDFRTPPVGQIPLHASRRLFRGRSFSSDITAPHHARHFERSRPTFSSPSLP
jgi:hypothetical protein